LSYIGPFTGEVGYELLYWLPYVRHRLGELNGHIAITRAGSGVWYPCQSVDGMEAIGSEIYTDMLVKRAKTMGTLKVFGTKDPVDKEILKTLGVNTILHPSELYNAIHEQEDWPHERLPKLDPDPHLPKDYIAMRFYIGDTFKNAEVARQLVKKAKEHAYVVLLCINTPCDDHGEIGDIAGNTTVVYTVKDSLSVISRIVSNAKQFICTYGGLSYLGPLYGVPTLAVIDGDPQLKRHTPQENRMIEAVGGNYARVKAKEMKIGQE
jgi:hypothetical protein